MKKVLAFILAAIACCTFVACASGANSTSKEDQDGKMYISKDIENAFMDELNGWIDASALSEANYCAKNRAVGSTGIWGDGVTFTSFKITKTETDGYNVTCYGKLYGKTNYGDPVSCAFDVEAYCIADDQEDNGFSIKTDLDLSSNISKD